jgi:hypothetical protein
MKRKTKNKYPDFAGKFSKALNKAGYITKAETITIPTDGKRPDLILALKDGRIAKVTIDIEIEQ